MSPTQRSLAVLKIAGAVAGVVERWNHFARIRQDFLGFADILAVEPGLVGVTAIQACTTGDQSKRLAKIALNLNVACWMAAGNRVEVWGWAKRGARGKRKTWTLSKTAIPLRGEIPPRGGA